MNYKIEGTPMPVLICNIAQGETLITEKGGMSWMSPNMKMETSTNGGIGKALGRMFSGESIFLNMYTCTSGQGSIAFSSSFPGSILPVDVTKTRIIAQKTAFLASESTVELSVHFSKKLGAGFFGGEGFIMQKLSGRGMAFLEIDGHMVEYSLAPGQSMVIDTGHLAAMEESVNIDIQSVKGVKNMLFGGEGVFNTVLTGPGRIWLQSMPATNLAGALLPFLHIK